MSHLDCFNILDATMHLDQLHLDVLYGLELVLLHHLNKKNQIGETRSGVLTCVVSSSEEGMSSILRGSSFSLLESDLAEASRSSI
jgi:hypothetical protein